MVEKCIGSLTDLTANHNVLVDLMGYDGWTAAFGLGEVSKGNKWSVGTICHSAHETGFVAEITSNKIYSLARESKIKIGGFPDFRSVLADLRNSSMASSTPEYSVCTPLTDGTLVTKQALQELWTTKNEGFKDEAAPCLL